MELSDESASETGDKQMTQQTRGTIGAQDGGPL